MDKLTEICIAALEEHSDKKGKNWDQNEDSTNRGDSESMSQSGKTYKDPGDGYVDNPYETEVDIWDSCEDLVSSLVGKERKKSES